MARCGWLAAALVISLIGIVPGAAAESEEMTLYLIGDGSGHVVTDAEGDGWFDLAEDNSGSILTSWISMVGSTTYANPYLPSFLYAAPVNVAGPINVHYFAAATGTAAGCGFTGTLYSGGAILQTTEVVTAGDGLSYGEYIFTFEGVEGSYANLAFQAAHFGADCGAMANEHIWGDSDYPARMIVPIGGQAVDVGGLAGQIINATVNGTVDIHHGFDNATANVYQYNWTTNQTEPTFGWKAKVLNGSVDILVIDPEGETAFDKTLNKTNAEPVEVNGSWSFQTHEGEEELFSFDEGTWNITLTFHDFRGNVTVFEVLAPNTTANETVDEPMGDDRLTRALEVQGIYPLQSESRAMPAPSLALALAGLAAVAYRRRN